MIEVEVYHLITRSIVVQRKEAYLRRDHHQDTESDHHLKNTSRGPADGEAVKEHHLMNQT